ncbi:hypothetical protein [Saccharothrix xinjiangensis]|uniref:PASTA domain-containing protein n=1 Tax=Saccharothrix xinjiangensis TaxID=204798 RepID=A0ABV9YBP3_9PSEU
MKLLPAALLAAALLTACSPQATTGNGPTTDEPLPPTATQAPPVTTTEAPPAPPAPPTAPVVPDTPDAPKTCTVPNVVGLVHQTAQDTMQASGLYMLREEDATGQGRLLVVDRNWTTTAQSVAAGAVVDCATWITLSAKKIGE